MSEVRAHYPTVLILLNPTPPLQVWTVYIKGHGTHIHLLCAVEVSSGGGGGVVLGPPDRTAHARHRHPTIQRRLHTKLFRFVSYFIILIVSHNWLIVQSFNSISIHRPINQSIIQFYNQLIDPSIKTWLARPRFGPRDFQTSRRDFLAGNYIHCNEIEWLHLFKHTLFLF